MDSKWERITFTPAPAPVLQLKPGTYTRCNPNYHPDDGYLCFNPNSSPAEAKVDMTVRYKLAFDNGDLSCSTNTVLKLLDVTASGRLRCDLLPDPVEPDVFHPGGEALKVEQCLRGLLSQSWQDKDQNWRNKQRDKFERELEKIQPTWKRGTFRAVRELWEWIAILFAQHRWRWSAAFVCSDTSCGARRFNGVARDLSKLLLNANAEDPEQPHTILHAITQAFSPASHKEGEECETCGAFALKVNIVLDRLPLTLTVDTSPSSNLSPDNWADRIQFDYQDLDGYHSSPVYQPYAVIYVHNNQHFILAVRQAKDGDTWDICDDLKKGDNKWGLRSTSDLTSLFGHFQMITYRRIDGMVAW